MLYMFSYMLSSCGDLYTDVFYQQHKLECCVKWMNMITLPFTSGEKLDVRILYFPTIREKQPSGRINLRRLKSLSL